LSPWGEWFRKTSGTQCAPGSAVVFEVLKAC
jgi:hypothetical protein